MKYLTRFLAPRETEQPQSGAPTEPTKPAAAPAVAAPEMGEHLEGDAYETYETPSDASFVGSVGTSPGGVPDFLEAVDAIGPTFYPPERYKPRSPRPDLVPTHGFTEAGHVVELPRTRRESLADPLRYVSGAGWTDWYDATEADRQYVRNPTPA